MNIDKAIDIVNELKKITQSFKVNCNLQDYEVPDALETLINEYNNLKQIEEAHRIENGELRERIKQEKEKNKSLKKQIKEMQEYYKNADFIFKDKIKAKIKELEEKSDYWNCDEIEVLKELLEEK